MKYIYFVRHGEALGNLEHFSQDIDTPLTDTGHRQAIGVAERCTSLPIQKVFTSDMMRAIETGEYIAKALRLDATPSPFFREWMTPKSVRGKKYSSPEYAVWIEARKKHYTDPNWEYEDVENFSNLYKRTCDAVELLESQSEEHVLVVSHEKYLRFMLAFVLFGEELTPEQHLAISNAAFMTNTGITVFKVEDGTWSLLTWNDHAHFAE